MSVTCVVPVYNEIRVLPRLLPELRRLQAEAEVVLVDGGSDDGSAEMLSQSGLRWLRSERGRAAQMNAGAAAGTGDVILFLHADTRLPLDAARRALEACRGGANAGFFRGRLDSTRPLLRLVGWLMNWRSRLTRIATGDQALFVRREVFERTGGFPALPLFEDVELSARLRREGGVVALRESVVTSARRWERHGAWRTILRMWHLRALYALGFPADRLARRYGTAR